MERAVAEVSVQGVSVQRALMVGVSVQKTVAESSECARGECAKGGGREERVCKR